MAFPMQHSISCIRLPWCMTANRAIWPKLYDQCLASQQHSSLYYQSTNESTLYQKLEHISHIHICIADFSQSKSGYRKRFYSTRYTLLMFKITKSIFDSSVAVISSSMGGIHSFLLIYDFLGAF